MPEITPGRRLPLTKKKKSLFIERKQKGRLRDKFWIHHIRLLKTGKDGIVFLE